MPLFIMTAILPHPPIVAADVPQDQRALKIECGASRTNPGVVSECAALDATTQCLELRLRLSRIHMPQPLIRKHDRTVAQRRTISKAATASQAGPLPILRPLHQAGTQSVPLDVAIEEWQRRRVSFRAFVSCFLSQGTQRCQDPYCRPYSECVSFLHALRLPPRTPPWDERALKVECDARRTHPGVVSKWLATLNATTQRLEFRFRLGGIHMPQPLSRKHDRTVAQRRTIDQSATASQTPPPPILRPLHQSRTQGIPLDVAVHRQIMIVLGDRK